MKTLIILLIKVSVNIFNVLKSGLKPFVPVFNHYIYRICSVIVIKSHPVNVFNNNRPNSKQTLILPVHIKSQLSYAATTEKFCIRKLYNL